LRQLLPVSSAAVVWQAEKVQYAHLAKIAPAPRQAACALLKPACHGGLMEKHRRPASRAERFWAGANAKGIPLQAIVATVAAVAATYLAGKLLYRLRDVAATRCLPASE
jgi:hypothetical protein